MTISINDYRYCIALACNHNHRIDIILLCMKIVISHTTSKC